MSAIITPNLNTISLFYKEGSSDKEYHLDILGDEQTGFTVQYRHGKRGQTLHVGKKNKCPVDYKIARSIFDEIVTAKAAKGYTEAEGGIPYQNTDNANKVSGILPQLLNEIEEDELKKYLKDDNWIMQQKMDGERRMIKKSKKTVEGVNRKGLIVSLPSSVESAIAELCGTADAILDGEMVGEVYWLFDILSMGVHSYVDIGCNDRLNAIDEWFTEIAAYHDDIRLVSTAFTWTGKKALYDALVKKNAEGVVFKRFDAPYKVGRPASGGTQVKFKFYSTATVRVKETTVDKRSVSMEVKSLGKWTEIGKVTIPVNHVVPDPKTIAEVRYLYAYHDGSLFQPTYLGPRSDADENDCVASQLKFKAPAEGEEEES